MLGLESSSRLQLPPHCVAPLLFCLVMPAQAAATCMKRGHTAINLNKCYLRGTPDVVLCLLSSPQIVTSAPE